MNFKIESQIITYIVMPWHVDPGTHNERVACPLTICGCVVAIVILVVSIVVGVTSCAEYEAKCSVTHIDGDLAWTVVGKNMTCEYQGHQSVGKGETRLVNCYYSDGDECPSKDCPPPPVAIVLISVGSGVIFCVIAGWLGFNVAVSNGCVVLRHPPRAEDDLREAERRHVRRGHRRQLTQHQERLLARHQARALWSTDRLLEVYDGIHPENVIEYDNPVWFVVRASLSSITTVVVKAVSSYHAFREALVYSEDVRDHMYACVYPEGTNISFDALVNDVEIRDENDEKFIMVKELWMR